MTRLTAEQEAIRTKARELAAAVIAPRAAMVDREEAYPWDNCRALREAGFFGMTIPKAYGGKGPRSSRRCWSSRRWPRSAASPGASWSRPTWARSARSWPTAPRRRRSSPPARAGRRQAGDLHHRARGRQRRSEMTTRADRKGDRYVLNGGKHWITGGGVSRLHLIFARVFDERRRAGHRRLHRRPRRDRRG
jgi:3-sulfinopropanoyl-CoA desulfinase